MKATRTINPLHFEDLEPHRFEDLVRQLLYNFRNWHALEATGRSGADDGIDIRGYEPILFAEDAQASSPDNRVWIIQCKRYNSMGPSAVREIVANDLEQQPETPYGYMLVASCTFSKKAYDAFRDEVSKFGVSESLIWGKGELEDQLFKPINHHLLPPFFGLAYQDLHTGAQGAPDGKVQGILDPILKGTYIEPAMVLIPGGTFLMGAPTEWGGSVAETPQFDLELPDFYMGLYPVTNQQFSEFVNSAGATVPQEAGWEGKIPPSDKMDHPMKGITWFDAMAYCQWLANLTEKKYCLPTEAHWEKAARGMDGRRYPWGPDWEGDRCNWHDSETKPVGAYLPQSPYGCYDMVGNVREWTTSLWGQKRSQPDPQFSYPWQDDARNNENAHKQIRRVLRGGSYLDEPENLTCTSRFSCFPERSGILDSLSGFRIMMLI
jgi:formylglycine-generating enzyme required for sulfatase activity